jgi:hypothetical protein
VGEVTSPGFLEGGDFFPVGRDLALVGVGLRSNVEACQQLMERDWLGTRRLGVVRDDFDKHQVRDGWGWVGVGVGVGGGGARGQGGRVCVCMRVCFLGGWGGFEAPEGGGEGEGLGRGNGSPPGPPFPAGTASTWAACVSPLQVELLQVLLLLLPSTPPLVSAPRTACLWTA